MTSDLDFTSSNLRDLGLSSYNLESVVDRYSVGTNGVFYSGSKKPELLTPTFPLLEIYDMSGTRTQLHLHGPNLNQITYGSIVPYARGGPNDPVAKLDGFRATSLANSLLNSGTKPIKKK